MYYTAYRYYSPDANRWLTRDPLGMVYGPNVYAYVVNNPVSMWETIGTFAATASFSMSISSLGNLQQGKARSDYAAFGRTVTQLASIASRLEMIGDFADTLDFELLALNRAIGQNSSRSVCGKALSC
ncbi:MAG: hypothetical protein KF886_13560 [Candidatus Hydrogenedentes bacterium]|nr:hypothetical protein [Candidatus Hydrogenedentota bacterium]